jgi:hypothetical protein
MTRIDSYTRAARTFYNLNRYVSAICPCNTPPDLYCQLSWISARIEALGGVFAAGLATYIVYGKGTLPTASDTGFSLNMAGEQV